MVSRRITTGACATAAALGTVAWANGRVWRDQKSNKLVHIERRGTKIDTDTLVVYFGGAFSKSSIHARNVIEQLEPHGTVLAPEYNLDRYNHRRTYEDTYSDTRLQLQDGAYSRLLVAGTSMGAINAFRLAGVMNREIETSMILADPLITSAGMKAMDRRAASVLTRVQPGPVLNPMLQPLTLGLIPGRDPAIHERGVEAHVAENLASMRGIKLSGYLDFARAILGAEIPDSRDFEDMKIVGIFSKHDPTLDMPAARLDFYIATELSDTSIINIPAYHATFPEQPNLWRDSWDLALARALS